MSFWNSIQQIVSDAGTSMANVGDSARKLVGRSEEQCDNEIEDNDAFEKIHPANPPRPGCPLVVPDTVNDGVSSKGSETAQNSFFPRFYGKASLWQRISTDNASSQSGLDNDTSSSPRTASLKMTARKFFNAQGLGNGGDAGNVDTAQDRFTFGKDSTLHDGHSSSGGINDFSGRKKGTSVKRNIKQSPKIDKPSCFMQMPQRWAEVTDTRSG